MDTEFNSKVDGSSEEDDYCHRQEACQRATEARKDKGNGAADAGVGGRDRGGHAPLIHVRRVN